MVGKKWKLIKGVISMTLNILFLTVEIEKRKNSSKDNQHAEIFKQTEKNRNEKFNEWLNIANLPNRW